MARQRLHHGSAAAILSIDPAAVRRSGFHCGTPEQAAMRAGRDAFMHIVEVDLVSVHRSRDQGGNWNARVARARRAGHDAIAYLNRFEGIPSERIEALAKSGDLGRLDSLSDSEFRKLVPEAADSYIILHPEDIRILEIITPDTAPAQAVGAEEDPSPSA